MKRIHVLNPSYHHPILLRVNCYRHEVKYTREDMTQNKHHKGVDRQSLRILFEFHEIFLVLVCKCLRKELLY